MADAEARVKTGLETAPSPAPDTPVTPPNLAALGVTLGLAA